jgi:type IV secretory pathway VirB2 component (pilin)
MARWSQIHRIRQIQCLPWKWVGPTTARVVLVFVISGAAVAQGSPFDTGLNAIQNLFTGTIAKVASLVAIVIGGYSFAHGEPGAKKALAGVAAGTGIAVLAVNVLSWLWGV